MNPIGTIAVATRIHVPGKFAVIRVTAHEAGHEVREYWTGKGWIGWEPIETFDKDEAERIAAELRANA